MTPDSLKERLRVLGFSVKAFAGRVRANERTVRRWTSGEQEIPGWVEVMLDLMKDAQDQGHGEFYAAWQRASNDAHGAFTEWLKRERPTPDAITIEIEITTVELCKAAKVYPPDLHLKVHVDD